MYNVKNKLCKRVGKYFELGWYNFLFLHRSVESEGLRFDSSWELRSFSLSHARDKTKNIFHNSLPSSKLTISLILFTAHLFLKFVIFLGGLEVWQWLCAAFQKCRRTDISWRPEGRGVLKLIYSWLLLLSLLLLWLLLFYSWGQKSRRDLLKTIVKGTCTSHPPLPLCVNLAVRNYFLVTCQCALSFLFFWLKLNTQCREMKNRTIKSMVCSVETEKCTDSLRYMLILNFAEKNNVVSSSFFKFMCPRFLVSN